MWLCRWYILIVEATALAKHYGIMLDCGSQGTRIYIFTWEKSQVLSDPIQIWKKKIKPGLSSFALNPGEGGKGLEHLVRLAKKRLRHEKSRFSEFPIYMRGTAGIRTIQPQQRDGLMNVTREILSKSGFRFSHTNAEILSGEEEGAFGWLSVNLIEGRNMTRPLDTFGAIDMGGFSTQITFTPPKSHDILQNFYSIVLQKHEIRLYTKSYQHYGLLAMSHRITASLVGEYIENADATKTFFHPCYPRNLKFVPNFVTRDAKFPLRIHMEGSGNFRVCEKLILKMFNFKNLCPVPECTFQGTYQPRLFDRQFVGFSNLAEIYELLNLQNDAPLAELRKTAQHICGLTKDEMDKDFSKTDEKDRYTLCYHASYVYTLLVDGLKFPTNVTQIRFKKAKKRADYSYVRGAMYWVINVLDV